MDDLVVRLVGWFDLIGGVGWVVGCLVDVVG